MLFQGDSFAVGEEAEYQEDGARFRVRVKEKVQSGRDMTLTLTVLEVFNGPFHGARCPKVGSDISVSEYDGAGINAGWTLSQYLSSN